MTPVPVGGQHPDTLDAKLLDAIDKRALPPPSDENSKARNAALTFLYLYMVMAQDDARYGFLVGFCTRKRSSNTT